MAGSEQALPPEHMSSEAKLKWARAMRRRSQASDGEVPVRMPRGLVRPEELAGRDLEILPVDQIVRARDRLWLRGLMAIALFALPIALMLLWKWGAPNSDGAADESPQMQVPSSVTNQVASIGSTVDGWFLVPAALAHQGLASQVAAMGPGSGLDPVPQQTDAPAAPPVGVVEDLLALTVFETALPRVPVSAASIAFADQVAVVSDPQVETPFHVPPQYSRQDLSVGVANLMGLIAGKPKLASESQEVAVAAPAGSVVFLRHGPGASPEKIRQIMNSLEDSGFDRVFRVAVPYRIGRTNVRFFHSVDADLAQAVTATVMPVIEGPSFNSPRNFSDLAGAPGPGTIEIWLSDKA
jgi:hypothetical protein